MLVDHHMDLVTSVCDRMVVLDFGKVIASGVPPEVRQNPLVLDAYLGREADAIGIGSRAGRRLMLAIEELTTDYGPVRAVDAISLTVAGRIGHRRARRERRRQDLDAPHDLRARPSDGRPGPAGGQDVTGLAVEQIVRRGLAHVPEGRGVIGELTVAENLRLGGLWRRREAAPIEEIYELFPPLRDRDRQPASRLSGGERQMLSIGRALMARPRILLLDEPSLGLAPRLVAQIMALVRGLADGFGLGVLLVEQNARSALSVADRGVVLNLGHVVADQPADAARRRRAASPRVPGVLEARDDEIHRPHAQRHLGRRRVRGGRSGAGADLASDPDRQFRPGRDADGDHVHRVRGDHEDGLVSARSVRRARVRAGVRRDRRANGDPAGGVCSAAERRDRDARPLHAAGGGRRNDLGQHAALVSRPRSRCAGYKVGEHDAAVHPQ